MSWPPFAFTEDSAWGRCYRDFLRHTEERSGSNNTLIAYRRILTTFFSVPAKLPETYTRADVEAFLHTPCRDLAHKGRPPAPGTMNNRLSILSAFYRYAAAYAVPGAHGANTAILTQIAPTAGLRQVQRDLHYRTITPADFERLFAAIPTDTVIGLRDRAIFLVYFWTARRRAEIVNLRYGDIEQAIFINEQGPRAGWLYHFRGKGRSRQDDSAELPAPAKIAIDRYLEASGRLATMVASDPLFTVVPGYVGRGNNTHQPLHPSTVWQILKRYARQAGIDPKTITTHSFRHAAAQQRYRAGEDVLSLQHLLRHASLQTTYIYLQALVGTADNGAKLLEEKFGKFSQIPTKKDL